VIIPFRAVAASLLAALVVAAHAGLPAAAPAPTDLDAFMQTVLAARDENWKKLQQYILDERERIDVRRSGNVPVWGEQRDYSWFIKDGFFIRSPVKVNGVAVSEADRRKAEDEYLKAAQARDRQRGRGQRAGGAGTAGAAAAADTPPDATDFNALLRQSRQPEFVESAYFLRFKFEQGKYALVGHETFEGRDVLRVEYYPARLFSHEQDQQVRRDAKGQTNREKDVDAAVEKMMNKVSLVTLWVDPPAKQIVKYTFDNVNFDFLPAAWLVRVSDLKASMTMSQPFKDVWLPRDVDMYFSAMLAVGAFDVRYHLDYHDYKEALTSGRIKKSGTPQ